MTPKEVLVEIRKLPLASQHEVLVVLTEQLNQTGPVDLEAQEKAFLESLLRKGVISEMPTRLPDDEFRRNFKLIEVEGEPLSETIIKERG
jgi:hypothetical protein